MDLDGLRSSHPRPTARIHELDDDEVVDLQGREIGHGRLQNLVFGGLAPRAPRRATSWWTGPTTPT